jgi:hypothetical protein
MYVNTKMIPVETVPGIRGRGMEESNVNAATHPIQHNRKLNLKRRNIDIKSL